MKSRRNASRSSPLLFLRTWSSCYVSTFRITGLSSCLRLCEEKKQRTSRYRVSASLTHAALLVPLWSIHRFI